ncbi:MAG: peptidylprolyl isomerase [Chitinispirillales bacterium]|jgi:peptidyl-prolyl cis-trans isomerase SurA|nr:peptidylprolyl isomerase [Chitinispirillales bacterium]
MENMGIGRGLRAIVFTACAVAALAFAGFAQGPLPAKPAPAEPAPAKAAPTETIPVNASSPEAAPVKAKAASAESAAPPKPAPAPASAAGGAAADSIAIDAENGVDGGEGGGALAAEPPPPPRPKPIVLQPGRLDGIAAVVGDEIILSSELEAYAYMRATASGADPESIDAKKLIRDCLSDLIDNKVLLVRAMGDSAIHVRNDEVESMLNNHINMILRQNNITAEQLEAQLLIQQGLSIARFKAEIRRAIREQLYKQKLQQGYYFSIKANRRDVERFYAQYADSLPEIGESFELLKLSLRPLTQDSVRQAAFDKIRAAKRELDAGGGFEEIAKKYSESPEGASGGDLGYLAKGSTTELAFEERAFSLPVGRASEPFETRLGYHIIIVEEKRDMSVKLRQILVRHAPTERQREALAARLDSLRAAIKDRAGFEAAAKEMSVDNATRARGGDLGWVTLLEVPSAVRDAVRGLEAGQISAPVSEGNEYSIYMVSQRADSRRLTLENDYALIAEKARDIFAQQRILDDVKKWREKVFVDIRVLGL